MDALGIDVKLLIGQIVNFLILFLILTKLLYKPVVNMLNERREKVAKSLENAKKIEEDLANTEKRIDEMISQAEERASNIIKESTKAGNTQKEEIIAIAKSLAEEEIAKAKIAINIEKIKASQELEKEVISLVGLATQKIIHKETTPEMQKVAVAEALDQFGVNK